MTAHWLELDLAVPALVAVALAVALGALVQGTIGLGLGLVAVPVVTLADPELMPGSMLVLGLVLPLLTLLGEARSIDWHGIAWSMPARAVGTIVGTWLVVVLSLRLLDLFVAIMVFVAILVTARAAEIPVRRDTLIGAGFVSGVTGTATAIGGPPMGLLYQSRPAAEVRATLAVMFAIGCAMSLVFLGVAGDLTVRQVVVGGVLVPALVLGLGVAVPLRRRIDAGRFRTLVLALCGASATVLLVRGIIG